MQQKKSQTSQPRENTLHFHSSKEEDTVYFHSSKTFLSSSSLDGRNTPLQPAVPQRELQQHYYF